MDANGNVEKLREELVVLLKSGNPRALHERVNVVIDCERAATNRVAEFVCTLGGMVRHALPSIGVVAASVMLSRVCSIAEFAPVESVGLEMEFTAA